MGHLDQFAKETFALETESVTRGGAVWISPPELSMSEVRLDGLLLVRDPAALAPLPEPWEAAREHPEIVIEIKMPGDHLDVAAVERALLRRQARQVQRCEDAEAPWSGHEPIWIVAPHVPASLSARYQVERFAPGCHRVGPAAFSFLWIAANDLPLADELVPFLVARSGRALDAFVRWVIGRRPIDWLKRVLTCLPMSAATYQDVQRNIFPKTDNPEILERRRMMTSIVLENTPGLREELTGEAIEQGRLEGERTALRRVLAARKLPLSAEDDTRIEACADLATLGRWIDQAVVATTTADALK